MQPVRLIVPGDYWDSQIYRGRLYLTTMRGDIKVYDWDRAVEALIRSPRDRLVTTCALARGDYLYGDGWSLVFGDPDVRSLLTEKFDRLAASPIEIELDNTHALLGVAAAPGGLPDDTEVYGNHLYAATSGGLLKAEIHRNSKRNKAGIGVARKVWDGSALSLRARRGGDLAIAAGDDGLFELGGMHHGGDEPHRLSSRNTLFADYAFASVYGSSDRDKGYLAAFTWEEQEDGTKRRRFVRTFDEMEIFSQRQGLSWASQEKIYICDGASLGAVRFTQRNVLYGRVEEPMDSPFQELQTIPVAMGGQRILGGGVAFFGTIIEHERGLVVVQSNGEVFLIEGPITRWRVFPRSLRYENHLHVVSEDRLDIYSFNHDYFVDQAAKVAGIEHRDSSSLRSSWKSGFMQTVGLA